MTSICMSEGARQLWYSLGKLRLLTDHEKYEIFLLQYRDQQQTELCCSNNPLTGRTESTGYCSYDL